MVRIGADMRILAGDRIVGEPAGDPRELRLAIAIVAAQPRVDMVAAIRLVEPRREHVVHAQPPRDRVDIEVEGGGRSEEHTSELQSLMRISYAVFCLKKKKKKTYRTYENQQ